MANVSDDIKQHNPLDDDPQQEDQIRTVMIGKRKKQFPIKSLLKLPYFKAKLSKNWQNCSSNDNVVVITPDDSFTFSLDDLSQLLLCNIDNNKLEIPSTLHPAKMISFVHCASFFCFKINDELLQHYYNHCCVCIDNEILKSWTKSNTKQFSRFAFRMLKGRKNAALTKINKQLQSHIQPKIQSRYWSNCNKEWLNKFKYLAQLFLNNYVEDVGCDMISVITSLREFAKRIAKSINSLNVKEEGKPLVSTLLNLLLTFRKHDKLFQSVQDSAVSFMVQYCKRCDGISDILDNDATNKWRNTVIYLIKNKYPKVVETVVGPTFDVIDDETTVEKMIKTVNNKQGEQLALIIMNWNIKRSSKGSGSSRFGYYHNAKYNAFCAKYYKTATFK